VLLAGLAVGLIGLPLVGITAGDERPEQLGGLGYNDAYDRTTVRIDVSVRDDDNNPVTGLKSNQFRLLRDGAEVELSSFEAFNPSGAVDPGLGLVSAVPDDALEHAQVESVEPAQPIYLILYIDSFNLRIMDRKNVLSSLRDFVKQMGTLSAQIMVVNNMDSPDIVQPFTTQTNAVLDALRRLRMATAGRDERDEKYLDLKKKIRETDSTQRTTGSTQSRELTNLYSDIRSYAAEEEDRLDESLNALRQIGMVLTGIPGRKCLVYVSNGLPLVIGAELLHQLGVVDRRFSGINMTYDTNKKRLYEAVATAFNTQDTTIYAIDATGTSKPHELRGGEDSRRFDSVTRYGRGSYQASLKLLAERTGGLAVIRSDDFAAGLDRIKSALTTYYTLEYKSDVCESDTVRSIEVELNNPAGYNLQYSHKIVEKSLASIVRDEVTSLLFFDAADNPMGIEVDVGAPEKVTPTQWMQPLKVLVPVKSLTMTLDGDEYVGRALLFFAIWSLQGKGSDSQRQPHTFRLTPQEYEERKDQQLSIDLRLLLKQGEHKIAIGLLDQVAHQTSRVAVQTTVAQP